MARPRSVRCSTMAVAAAGAVAVSALPAQAEERPDSLTDHYVALGDSFTAGPLIPEQYGSPALCLRSRENYPNVVAEALEVAEFHDASCSAAATEHMTEPQDLPLGTADPQFDALTVDTTLVTVGIGGNDIDFGEILINCSVKSGGEPHGAPCREFYTTEEGDDELAERVEEAAGAVADVLVGIRERSPEATVAVVGYPRILPEREGCWPVVPIAKGDVAYLDGVQTELNAMLEREAAEAGAVFVDVSERGHGVCQSRDTRWVEGVFPTNPAAPVHPNETGMAEVGARVLASLGDDAGGMAP